MFNGREGEPQIDPGGIGGGVYFFPKDWQPPAALKNLAWQRADGLWAVWAKACDGVDLSQRVENPPIIPPENLEIIR